MKPETLEKIKEHYAKTSPGMRGGDACARAFVSTVGALLKHIEQRERYHEMLARAIRNAKQPPPAALVAALHSFTATP